MKKFAVLLTIAMAFALGACGKDACDVYDDDLNCDQGLGDIPFLNAATNSACDATTKNATDAQLDCAIDAATCAAWDACFGNGVTE